MRVTCTPILLPTRGPSPGSWPRRHALSSARDAAHARSKMNAAHARSKMNAENAYLVGLRLSGKKVVVVGGGTVAQRRLPLLIAHGADVHVIARAATPAVEALAHETPGITLALRDFQAGDLDGAWYVIAATNDGAVNAAIADEAQQRRIFCVRADIAREGSAVTPATFDYDGLS